MTYVFDALVVLLPVLCVVLGWHRGFVRTVSGLVALVAAVLVAAAFSGPIAKVVYANAVEPKVTAALESYAEGELLPNAEQLDSALERFPAFVTALLEMEGLDSGFAIFNKLDQGQAKDAAVDTVTQQVITPVVLPLVRMLCSVVLFLLTYVVAALLLRMLNVVTKLPLIKQMNNVLGLLAGVVTGGLWVLFLVRALYAVALLSVFEWLTPSVLDETLLISQIATLLPVGV